MIYTLLPNDQPDTDAGNIEDFLVAQGVIVTSVSVMMNAEKGVVASYVIDAESDPTKLLAGYNPPTSMRDQAMQTIQTLKTKMDADTATLADIRQTLSGVIDLIST